MNLRRSAVVAYTILALVAGYFALSTAVHAQTSQDVNQLVIQAKTPAEHQYLVKWYEGREREARTEASLYRRMASAYRESREPQQKATVTCEQIAAYFDDIAEHLEVLAEQQRHMAASTR